MFYAGFLAIFLGVLCYLFKTTIDLESKDIHYRPPDENHPLYPLLGYFEIERTFDGIAYSKVLEMSSFWPAVCSVLYLLLMVSGRDYMRDKEGIVPRWLIIIWNLALSIFSIFGAWRMVTYGVAIFSKMDFWDAYHEYTCVSLGDRVVTHPEVGFWIHVFCLSKMPEMIDTVLLVFNKKPVQFLHWFHHITVMWFCYMAWAKMTAAGPIYCGMNFFVHAIMYMWYAFAAAKFKPSMFAMLITTLQILQMVVGSMVAFYALHRALWWEEDCGTDKGVLWYGVLMYGSYLFLFCSFFMHRYIFPKKAKIAPAPSKKAENHGKSPRRR